MIPHAEHKLAVLEWNIRDPTRKELQFLRLE